MMGEHYMSRIGKVRRDILFVMDHWPDLREARVPGTRRPWAQTKTRKESRRQAGTEDFHARTVLGIGPAPAPAHVDVLDALVDVLAVSVQLSDMVSQHAGIDRLAYPQSPYDDPRPYLRLALAYLEAADEAAGGEIVPATLDHKSDASIVRVRARTAAALRLILGGHVLDADCPWCRSGPLKIEIHTDEPLVVCRSRRVCEPPEADCGTWVYGRPAWIQPEWEWLAKQIRHTEDLEFAS